MRAAVLTQIAIGNGIEGDGPFFLSFSANLMFAFILGYTSIGQAGPAISKETVVDHNGTASVVTDLYYDGMGRLRQTQVRNGTKDVISGTEFDQLGRASISIKPFVADGNGHLYFSSSLKTAANAFYTSQNGQPDAGSFAYGETEFDPDPYGKVRQIGGAGAAYRLDGPNTARYWNLGRATSDFLTNSQLGVHNLDLMVSVEDAAYKLLIAREPNGNFLQTLTDRFGRIVKVWADPDPSQPGPSGKLMVSYQYDGAGAMLKMIPHGTSGSPESSRQTQMNYSTTGQTILADKPDAGVRRYMQNRLGDLRFIEDSRQAGSGSSLTNFFTVFRYDQLGRMRETGVFRRYGSTDYFAKQYADDPAFPEGQGYLVKVKCYFDKADVFMDEMDIPPQIAALLTNLRGRSVGNVAYDESGYLDAAHRVVEAFAYDDEGRIARKFKWIPSLPMQEFVFTYYPNGKLASETSPAGTITYQFDNLERLADIRKNGKALVSYGYDELNRLATKNFYKSNGTELAGKSEYAYQIHDLVANIKHSLGSGPVLFQESIAREGATPPTYDDGIGSTSISYPTMGFLRNLKYSYDGLGRSTGVSNVSAGGSSDYEEAVSYDVLGRITQKRAGSPTLTGFTEQYMYADDANQLRYVDNHPAMDLTPGGNDNFLYDPNGNLVLNRSKGMVIVYDWRNKPVRYKFFNQIPDQAWVWSTLEELDFTSGVTLSYSIEAIYDATGNRVLKRKVSY